MTKLSYTLQIICCLAFASALAYEGQSYSVASPSIKQLQVSLNAVQHSISNHESVLSQMEEKFSNMEAILDNLRRQLNDQAKGQRDNLKSSQLTMEAKINDFNFIQKALLADLQVIKKHADETTSFIDRQQEQLKSLQKQLDQQNQNIANLHSAVKSIAEILQPSEELETKVHQVRAGDSLEKIAQIYGTTVKALKERNDLLSDKIKIGQKLKIPPK